jgi:hypothetical protein
MDDSAARYRCASCLDLRWVCEKHPDQPWPLWCDCSAGTPCADCNEPLQALVPSLPPGWGAVSARAAVRRWLP